MSKNVIRFSGAIPTSIIELERKNFGTVVKVTCNDKLMIPFTGQFEKAINCGTTCLQLGMECRVHGDGMLIKKGKFPLNCKPMIGNAFDKLNGTNLKLDSLPKVGKRFTYN